VRVGTLGGGEVRVTGVTTLGSNGAWLCLERKVFSVISFGAEQAWEEITLDGTIWRGMGVGRPWEARLDGQGFELFVI
jgi:hypothetical protein